MYDITYYYLYRDKYTRQNRTESSLVQIKILVPTVGAKKLAVLERHREFAAVTTKPQHAGEKIRISRRRRRRRAFELKFSNLKAYRIHTQGKTSESGV